MESNIYKFEIHEEQQQRPQRNFNHRQDTGGNILTTSVEAKYSREIPPTIYSRNGDNIRQRSFSYMEYDKYESNRLNLKYCFGPSGVLRIIEIDILLSSIAAIFFLVFSCLEAYYSTGAWANNCNDIGGDGIIHNGCRLIIEWAFAAFFFFILFVLYAASAFFAARECKYEEREKRRQREFGH
uniref:MARVEL domain-containing protein n=1 Tax=Meloidogyne hapla TaxID=6305 RepID=A0A1I8B0A0_MELHA